MFYDEYKITDTDYLKSLQTEIKNNTVESFRNLTNVKGQMTYWNYFIDKKIFNKVKDITYKYFLKCTIFNKIAFQHKCSKNLLNKYLNIIMLLYYYHVILS